MPKPIVVLDFDGTVCLGDDPVRLYADEVSSLMPAHSPDILAGLDAFLRGDLHLPGVEDGYEAVFELSKPARLRASQLTRAYVTSRERLEQGEARRHAPPGLPHMLEELAALQVHVVLLTNAPEVGVVRWLNEQDLFARFHHVRTDAGKPRHMTRHLSEFLTAYGDPAAPGRLLSIGDVWANDVAPALQLGAHGFYIDRFNLRTGESTATAASLAALYPEVLAWARAARDGLPVSARA